MTERVVLVAPTGNPRVNNEMVVTAEVWQRVRTACGCRDTSEYDADEARELSRLLQGRRLGRSEPERHQLVGLAMFLRDAKRGFRVYSFPGRKPYRETVSGRT